MQSIGYIRVSTKEQGQSGNGLAAQREIIARLAPDGLANVYCDIDSGANDARPELAKALSHAKRIGGQVVVAKLDRLARSVSKIKGLIDAGHKLVFGDIPESHGAGGTLHLTVMAAVAEFERERGRERTREGLAQAKVRLAAEGRSLGNPDGGRALADWTRQHGNGAAVASIKRAADEWAELHRDALIEALDEGLSHRAIARRFNDQGIITARGGRWSNVQVGNLITRLAA